ncbi:MAG: DUF1311 domain-containing protein [Leptolyngbya sp. DLM2.Bin15]|nr:MAG: DUF1311 domain-containing protein [Leptolyngbya sp. DLM2.Bin15]
MIGGSMKQQHIAWVTGLAIALGVSLVGHKTQTLQAQAPNVDCQAPRGTPEYNYCAQEHYAEVDTKLNRVYQDWKERLNPAAQTKLTDAALDWIDYRDAHCAFDVREAIGGTGYSAYLNDCLASLTEARTAELEYQTTLIP